MDEVTRTQALTHRNAAHCRSIITPARHPDCKPRQKNCSSGPNALPLFHAERGTPIMKLLFVIKFLSVAGGGAERVLTQVASALGSRGHQVAVLTYDAADTADFYPLSVGVRRLRLGLGKATSATLPETVER